MTEGPRCTEGPHEKERLSGKLWLAAPEGTSWTGLGPQRDAKFEKESAMHSLAWEGPRHCPGPSAVSQEERYTLPLGENP